MMDSKMSFKVYQVNMDVSSTDLYRASVKQIKITEESDNSIILHFYLDRQVSDIALKHMKMTAERLNNSCINQEKCLWDTHTQGWLNGHKAFSQTKDFTKST